MEKMERPFGIYEKAIKPQEWEKMFADARNAGYQSFELSIDESDARLTRLVWSDKQCDLVREAARNQGIRMLSACFSGHRRYPMGSADPKTEKKAMEMMRQGIELCERVGIRILQVAGYDAFYEPRNEGTEKRYRENLEQAVKMAEKLGVMLAIEPVEMNLVKVRDTLEVIRKINSPWLQIYPDIANMQSLGIDPAIELPIGRGHITAIHVRDALPDFFYDVPPGDGTMDFISVFKQLDNMQYHGPLIIEMWNEQNPDYFNKIKDARIFMLDKIAQSRMEDV